MKSKISFFNATVFRKDITRFFPAWLLYTILVMISLSNLSPSSNSTYRALPVITHILPFLMINLIYAPIVASLLFGDMFKRRLCNGIHALPLRRETLFGTHLVSGLLFSLVPNCLYFICAFVTLGSDCYIALYWLLIVTMSYLCFFGIAVFSANCTGTRFAMFCVYTGIVLLPTILYNIYVTLFQPLLYGIVIEATVFTRFSPVYLYAVALEDLTALDSLRNVAANYSPSWLWYLGFLLEGLVLGGAGLVLYRKRQTETAGNFLAHKIFLPVVLVLCSICISLELLDFFGVDGLTRRLVMLLPALLLGVILTQMLLRRSTRVFIKSTWVTYGLLAGGLGIALLLTALDPIGITTRLPKAEEVTSVTVSQYTNIDDGHNAFVKYTQQEEIGEVISLHKFLIRNKNFSGDTVYSNSYTDYLSGSSTSVPLVLNYTLEDGSTVHREYSVPIDSPMGLAYRKILASPEYVLSRMLYKDWNSFCRSIDEMEVGQSSIAQEDHDALLEVLKADFDAGNMVQDRRYHREDSEPIRLYLIPYPTNFSYQVALTDNSVLLWPGESQTYQWLVKHGYFTPDAE